MYKYKLDQTVITKSGKRAIIKGFSTNASDQEYLIMIDNKYPLQYATERDLSFPLKDIAYTLYSRSGNYVLRLNETNRYFKFSDQSDYVEIGTLPRTRSYKHLGKRISLDDLPDTLKQFVIQTINNF